MSDYLGHPAFGSSDIIKMMRSFAYYKWRKANPEKSGRPLVIGSVTHLMLEAEVKEDEKLHEQIEIYAGGSSKTKGFETFVAQNPQKLCVDEVEHDLCKRMVRALVADEEVMSFLGGAIAEPTIMGNYPDTSVPCKIRPDYLHVDKGVSINIKTTTDASESGFIYSAKEYSYDFQSAFYIDILTQELDRSFDEVHILVEKVEDGEPVPVKIYSFDDETIGWARSQISALMAKLPECIATGVWPKLPSRLETINLPIFARKIFQQ